MLALILATKGDVPADFSRSTLIGQLSSIIQVTVLMRDSLVVPLSVMSNWEKQIQDHCTPGSLSSCVYYGSTRSMTSEELKAFDIVITTYQTVAGQHTGGSEGNIKKKKKSEHSLFEVRWKVSDLLVIVAW
jgi:SWI/SNF-related matrix-associated actin-dependent regulator of chromatin subfamily A3